MASKKEIPRRILKLLDRRRRLAQDLMSVSQEITEYCEKIGIDACDPDACLLSDYRIYCEFDGAYDITLNAIRNHLSQKGS